MLLWIAIISAGWALSGTFVGVVVGRAARLRDTHC
jgi:hypothetical protein